MAKSTPKSLPLAIGLNILLPGMGYIYMGKIVVGILALLLVVGIYSSAGLLYIFWTWLIMNALMAIDMVILDNKRKQQYIAESMIKCPYCAELIKKEARICKHCGRENEHLKEGAGQVQAEPV